jgi:alkylation response protein AidB-like acyl-CoA dehydrogenase
MLSPDQQQIRDLAREFAERELRPNAERWDHEAAFPRAVVEQLGELGFLGMLIPEEWDGLDLDTTSYLLALEQIAWGDASVAVAMSVHNSLPTQMILAQGSEEQKERWLKPMARGEMLGAFALSEADAGSDAAAMVAQARRADGGWVLNGTKAWITNGGFGDVVIAMCRTDEPGDRKGAKGIGAFIIPTDAEGYVVGKKEDKMGQRASETVGIAFEELFVPDAQLLGDPSRRASSTRCRGSTTGGWGSPRWRSGSRRRRSSTRWPTPPSAPVRPADRPLPGDAVQAGGHGGARWRRRARSSSARPPPRRRGSR